MGIFITPAYAHIILLLLPADLQNNLLSLIIFLFPAVGPGVLPVKSTPFLCAGLPNLLSLIVLSHPVLHPGDCRLPFFFFLPSSYFILFYFN